MCYKAGSRARFHSSETDFVPAHSHVRTSGFLDQSLLQHFRTEGTAIVMTTGPKPFQLECLNKFNLLTPSLGIWMSCQCFKGAGRPASPTCFCQTCQKEHLPLINSESCGYAGPLKAIPLTSVPKHKSRCLPLGSQLLKCWKRKKVVLLNK